MGHQITQIARTENGGKYKVSISIPFELGWIERVKLNITTREQKNVYPMKHVKNENDMAYFETTIELPRYAVYHYYFSFEANSRFQYYKKENTSGDNSVTDEECWKLSVNFDVPEWAKGAIMYQIFVDRYKRTRGLEKPKMKGRDIHNNWTEPPVVGPNKDGKWCVDFYCGDVKGITDTMKYLKKLGVDIIYLCPISESQSNHRYDTADYKSVDLYAGTTDMMKEMCEKAHKYGIKVILDVVFNHTGNDSIYYNEYGHYDSIGAYQVAKDPRYKGMVSPYSDFYDTDCHFGKHEFKFWWNQPNMPKCNGKSEHWRNFICGKEGAIYFYFSLGIDGLRLDVADELLDEFVEDTHTAAVRNKPYAFLMAEMWENNPMDRGFLKNAKGIHSLMNYRLTDAIMRYYKYCDVNKLREALRFISTEYPEGTILTLMNFTSTHDISRAIEIFGCNIFNEYALWAWDLIKGNGDCEWIKQHKMTSYEYHCGKRVLKSYCFALTFLQGIFSNFYGDEVGVQGVGNLANRAPYPWGHRDKDLLKYFRGLGKIRKENQFLRTAEQKIVKIDHEHFVFERYNKNESIMVIVSRTHHITKVDLPEEYRDGEVVARLKSCTKQELSPFGAIAIRKTK